MTHSNPAPMHIHMVESDVNTLKNSQTEDPVMGQMLVGHLVSIQSQDLHPRVGQRSNLSAETSQVEL